MIRKISLSFLVAFLIIAICLKINGVNDLFVGAENGTRESFYYSFLKNLAYNLKVNPFTIPKIPILEYGTQVSGFIEVLINFVNFFSGFINVLITLLNVIINLVTFVYTLFEVVFSYFDLSFFGFN